MVEKREKSFEQKMTDIEKIVNSLEKKEMPLEQSLEFFEKGTTLIRECQKILQTAEQKITILNNEPFKHENDN